jgi:hypothetical protein
MRHRFHTGFSYIFLPSLVIVEPGKLEQYYSSTDEWKTIPLLGNSATVYDRTDVYIRTYAYHGLKYCIVI